MAICSSMAEPVLAFQLPEMDVLLRGEIKEKNLSNEPSFQLFSKTGMESYDQQLSHSLLLFLWFNGRPLERFYRSIHLH